LIVEQVLLLLALTVEFAVEPFRVSADRAAAVALFHEQRAGPSWCWCRLVIDAVKPEIVPVTVSPSRTAATAPAAQTRGGIDAAWRGADLIRIVSRPSRRPLSEKDTHAGRVCVLC